MNFLKAIVWLNHDHLSCCNFTNYFSFRQKKKKSGESNFLTWYVLLSYSCARMRTTWLKFSFFILIKNDKPDLTPMFLCLDMVTLFSICFFRCDHPGDNRHYHPVLIFLRSSIFEPCHATFNWKRPILAETPSKIWNLKFEAFFWENWLALHFSDRNLNLKESKFVTFKKW